MFDCFTTISSPTFDYAASAPSDWGVRLDALRGEGAQRIVVPILWGNHEQLRGIREFVKPSRLRLERALSAIQEKGLSAELVVGFPAHPDAFPDWTRSLSPKALVPRCVWEGEAGPLGLEEVPNATLPEVEESFVAFLEEVGRIIRLYLAPEGPVKSVRFDLGVLRHDLSVASELGYGARLSERYGSLNAFNRAYGTSFRDFEAALSPTGLRVLSDKRPWLAAFDLKWCRSARLRELERRIRLSPSLKGLFREEEGAVATATVPRAVVVDSVLIEGSSKSGGTTGLPVGLVHGASATALRIWEYAADRGRENGVVVRLIGEELPEAKIICVVNGPYLSRSHGDWIVGRARSGTRLFFPFGFPKYDENLTAHFATEAKPVLVRSPVGSIVHLPAGSGGLWGAVSPLAPSDALWGELESWMAWLETLTEELPT